MYIYMAKAKIICNVYVLDIHKYLYTKKKYQKNNGWLCNEDKHNPRIKWY